MDLECILNVVNKNPEYAPAVKKLGLDKVKTKDEALMILSDMERTHNNQTMSALITRQFVEQIDEIQAKYKNLPDNKRKRMVAREAKRLLVNISSRSPLAHALTNKGVPLESLTRAIEGKHHSDLNDLIKTYRHQVFDGFKNDAKGQREIVRAIWKKSSNESANKFADSIRKVMDNIFDDFNAAGGKIPYRKNYLLQRHDSHRMRKSGRERWVNYTYDKLDPRATAQAMGIEGKNIEGAIKDNLNKIFDNKVDGKDINLSDIIPGVTGAVANRHIESRILHFAGPDEWFDYNAKFGSGSLLRGLFDNISVMSSEIAQMRKLGHNPERMLRTMAKYIDKNIGDGVSDAGVNTFNITTRRLVGRQEGIHKTFQGARNLFGATKLGMATISALSDTAFMSLSSIVNGFGVGGTLRMYMRFMKNLTPGSQADRDLLTQLGNVSDVVSNVSHRYYQVEDIREFGITKSMVDATVRGTGLNHWTLAAKAAFRLEMMHNVARFAKEPQKMSKRVKGHFASTYGIRSNDWTELANAVNHRGYVDLNDITDETLHGKLYTLLDEETRLSVPEPNDSVRAFMTQGLRPGTLTGEIIRSITQFQSFPISVMAAQFGRVASIQGAPGRIAYFSSLIAGTTLMGTVSYNAKQLLAGKEMIDPTANDAAMSEFLIRGLDQGGSIGIIGSLAFADPRYGYDSMAQGPSISLASNTMAVFMGSVYDAIKGESDLNKELSKYTKLGLDQMPNWWMTKYVFDRGLRDVGMKWADPDWASKTSRIRTRMGSERGQDYLTQPGRGAQPFRAVERAAENIVETTGKIADTILDF